MSKQIFKNVSYNLSKLMDDIEMGDIGLPDIQRPFVWKNTKVRDLFDSMYRGYPVGYFLFWDNNISKGVKQIGTNEHQKVAQTLIVDGQQRLTSLYSVFKGIPVVRENYESENIEIAFKPLDGSFEVADASIRRNPEWIPNISKVFSKDASQYKIVGDYIATLLKSREATKKDFTAEEKSYCEQNLQNLFSISSFPFTALELSSDIDEEQVAEVFVRINSKGKTLNQSDFILTLMSVFWEDGRKELESFCRLCRKSENNGPSPFNYFIDAEPDQLLRVSIGIGFRRARLKYAYSLLRGKDLETGIFSNEQRDAQFKILIDSQKHTLNIQNWHDFLLILQKSGFRSKKMISSKTTLIYSYVLYLIGKVDLKINNKDLNKAIGKWFFTASLTSRYTETSPEGRMEKDLASLRSINDSDSFINWINNTIELELTEDFWQVTLPGKMETSSANSPILHCYNASLNLLEAKALFSDIRIWDALDPTTIANKSKVERHHLFPKSFLKEFGINVTKEINQIANYALVEWHDNLSISDSAPAEYYPKYCDNLGKDVMDKMDYWHALPVGWESMTYNDFLKDRRKLMASVIKDGYNRLNKGEVVIERPENLEDMVAQGEGPFTEFKSTLRINLHTNEKDPRMEHAVLKTINGFLNSNGGTLIIGIADDGEAIGLDVDGFQNNDKMDLHLGNLIKSKLGPETTLHIQPKFENYKDKKAMVVKCNPSQVPVYLKNGNEEEFFIRSGGSSSKLTSSQMTIYIKQRFPNF